MKKTATRLADGRELIYYDARDDAVRDAVDQRPLDPIVTRSEIRHDRLLGDDVAVASHRQGRTYHPPADECPLCPSRDGRLSEIPASDYDVAVFENRFPSLAGDAGRCEVVCFTSDHDASFADLTEEQAALVLDAWTDRTAGAVPSPLRRAGLLLREPRRGDRRHPRPPARADLRVPLHHPAHRADAPLARRPTRRRPAGESLRRCGRRELADGRRVVLEGEHWVAFVPYAAHWPYEVHLYPKRRVPDLLALDDAARTEFPQIYLELLRRFDRIFDGRGGGKEGAGSRRRRTSPPGTRRRSASGRSSSRRPRRLRASPRAFHHPPHFRQAEVSRGFRIRHECVHQ